MLTIKNGKVHQTYSLPRAKDSLSHVYLVFNPSRSIPHLATPLAAAATSEAEAPAFKVPANVVHIPLSRLLAADSPQVEIVSVGEPQELVKVVLAGTARLGSYEVYQSPGTDGVGNEAQDVGPSAELSAALAAILPRTACSVFRPDHRRTVNAALAMLADGSGGRSELLPGDLCLDPGKVEQPVPRDGDITTELPSEEDYVTALCAAVSRDPGLEWARRLFADLDLQTHPRLVKFWPPLIGDTAAQASRIASVNEVSDRLAQRLFERAAAYSTNPARPPAQYVPAAAPSEANWRVVEQVLRETIEPHLDSTSFEAAFEQFAGGELRLPLDIKNTRLWACQPSSGFFYMFAEFALLTLDRRCHPTFWRQVHNVMVRSQLIFSTVYAPPSVEHDSQFAHYNACNFHDLVRAWWQGETGGIANKTKLAQLYGPANTLALHHHLVAGHTGVFLPGLRSPTA